MSRNSEKLQAPSSNSEKKGFAGFVKGLIKAGRDKLLPVIMLASLAVLPSCGNDEDGTVGDQIGDQIGDTDTGDTDTDDDDNDDNNDDADAGENDIDDKNPCGISPFEEGVFPVLECYNPKKGISGKVEDQDNPLAGTEVTFEETGDTDDYCWAVLRRGDYPSNKLTDEDENGVRRDPANPNDMLMSRATGAIAGCISVSKPFNDNDSYNFLNTAIPVTLNFNGMYGSGMAWQPDDGTFMLIKEEEFEIDELGTMVRTSTDSNGVVLSNRLHTQKIEIHTDDVTDEGVLVTWNITDEGLTNPVTFDRVISDGQNDYVCTPVEGKPGTFRVHLPEGKASYSFRSMDPNHEGLRQIVSDEMEVDLSNDPCADIECNGTFCEPEVCIDGKCTADEEPCEDGEVCIEATKGEEAGKCVECAEDSDCTSDHCYEYACVECAEDNDCTDVRCNAGFTCTDNTCTAPTEYNCGGNTICDEVRWLCVGCLNDNDCDDKNKCNGDESCNDGVCVNGTPLQCGTDFCSPESCDPVFGCVDATAPCEGQLCDEENDVCVECFDETDCTDDGLFCTTEVCESGVCGVTDYDCATDVCDDSTDSCVECLKDDDCGSSKPYCDDKECVECEKDSQCDNDKYCDGKEECNSSGKCIDGDPVDCNDGTCDEGADECDCDGTGYTGDNCETAIPAPEISGLAIDCSSTGGECWTDGEIYPVTFNVTDAGSCIATAEVISGSGTPGSCSSVTIDGNSASFEYTTGSNAYNVIRITTTCTGEGGNDSSYIDVTLE